MISVTEAKQIILNHAATADPVRTKLGYAYGKTLAEDVYSMVDMPAFPQSSVDGYAFNFAGWMMNKTLPVVAEIAAGNSDKDFFLQPAEAVRIFTGAPVPPGADTVVMQEKVSIENDLLLIKDELIMAGANVRLQASEIQAGDIALGKGSFLNPAAIGFLACIGVSEIFVYPSPVVAIVITGDELQMPGMELQFGQVYESNSFALRAALQSVGIEDIILFYARDNLTILTGLLKDALLQSDIVLLTGGVSVGDYDFVVKAAEDCGVEKLFHKVKQKPGRPLYFGKTLNKIVFGLPGNPSSVLTCFYQYVVLALQVIKGNQPLLKKISVPLKFSLKKPAGLTHFLKGSLHENSVTALTGQESFRMRSFAEANCLIEAGESVTEINKDELVTVYLLPGCN